MTDSDILPTGESGLPDSNLEACCENIEKHLKQIDNIQSSYHLVQIDGYKLDVSFLRVECNQGRYIIFAL